MRVILVGSASGRAALRRQFSDEVDVVGETGTLAEARALEIDADAFVLAPRDQRSSEADEIVVDSLTRRELEVLGLVAEGLPNKAIAAKLTISDQTVKFHVRSICDKLGAVNRTDAVRRALRRGLISV